MKMRHVGAALALICLVVCATHSRAVETNAETSAPAIGRPERNPFWPVGFDPAAKARALEQKIAESLSRTPTPPPPPKPATEQDWTEARKWLRIEGVSRTSTGESVALINSRVNQVGEFVSINYNGRVYRWTVKAIDENGVDLARLDEKPLESMKK